MLSQLFITVLIFVLMYVYILIIWVIIVVLNCWSCCTTQTLWWYSVLHYNVLVQIRDFQKNILAVGIAIRCGNKCWRTQGETVKCMSKRSFRVSFLVLSGFQRSQKYDWDFLSALCNWYWQPDRHIWSIIQIWIDSIM